MAIEDWMPALAERIAGIEGLEAVYFPDPNDSDAAIPGTLSVFPCAVIMPQRGGEDELSTGAGGSFASTELQVTLYLSESILPEAYNAVIPYIGRMKRRIAGKITLGGLVHHVLPWPTGVGQRWWEGPGSITYAGVSHIGIAFRLLVKEHETFTVAA